MSLDGVFIGKGASMNKSNIDGTSIDALLEEKYKYGGFEDADGAEDLEDHNQDQFGVLEEDDDDLNDETFGADVGPIDNDFSFGAINKKNTTNINNNSKELYAFGSNNNPNQIPIQQQHNIQSQQKYQHQGQQIQRQQLFAQQQQQQQIPNFNQQRQPITSNFQQLPNQHQHQPQQFPGQWNPQQQVPPHHRFGQPINPASIFQQQPQQPPQQPGRPQSLQEIESQMMKARLQNQGSQPLHHLPHNQQIPPHLLPQYMGGQQVLQQQQQQQQQHQQPPQNLSDIERLLQQSKPLQVGPHGGPVNFPPAGPTSISVDQLMSSSKPLKEVEPKKQRSNSPKKSPKKILKKDENVSEAELQERRFAELKPIDLPPIDDSEMKSISQTRNNNYKQQRGDRQKGNNNNNYNNNYNNYYNNNNGNKRIQRTRWIDQYNNLSLPKTERYKGLMSQSEKGFVARIQISQLVTETPLKDDFYNQIYKSLKAGDTTNLHYANGSLGSIEANGSAISFGDSNVNTSNMTHKQRAFLSRMRAQVQRLVEGKGKKRTDSKDKEENKEESNKSDNEETNKSTTEVVNNSTEKDDNSEKEVTNHQAALSKLLAGSLGKIAARSSKAPRQTLQIGASTENLYSNNSQTAQDSGLTNNGNLAKVQDDNSNVPLGNSLSLSFSSLKLGSTDPNGVNLGVIYFIKDQTKRPLTKIQTLRLVESIYSDVLQLEILETEGAESIKKAEEKLLEEKNNEESEKEDDGNEVTELTVEEIKQAIQKRKDEIHQHLWISLGCSDGTFDPNTTHPLASILKYDKGKRLFPRILHLLTKEQSFFVIQVLLMSLKHIDVFAEQPISLSTLDLTQLTPTQRELTESVELFMANVIPPIVAFLMEISLEHVNMLMRAILGSHRILWVAKSRPGLALLTVLLSRAEMLKQGGNTANKDTQLWGEIYNYMFQQIYPNFHTLPQSPQTWQFLAAVAVGATTPDHQTLLLSEVRNRVFASAKSEDQEEVDGVDLFLGALGLGIDSKTLLASAQQ